MILRKYVDQRQTLKDLAAEYNHSLNWVKVQLTRAQSLPRKIDPVGLAVIADVTFFSRTYGFIVFRAPKLKRNLYFKAVPSETIMEYRLGREAVEKMGFKLAAIVLDGRPGVRNLFLDIPVQMCHFHQKKIVQRNLTLKPKLEAGIELKVIADTLCRTNELEFSQRLEAWHLKWSDFLKERTTDQFTDRWHYTHRRIRSAYYSLKKNLSYLFTYQRYPELNIPNTTNSLDGSFSYLKQKVNIHRGLNEQTRQKIIEYILDNQVHVFDIKPHLAVPLFLPRVGVVVVAAEFSLICQDSMDLLI